MTKSINFLSTIISRVITSDKGVNMNEQIEKLISYIKQTTNDFQIILTEDGFNIQFIVFNREMNTFLEVTNESFTIRSKGSSINVPFQEQNLEYKFKLLINYIALIKQIISDTVKCSTKPIEVEEEIWNEIDDNND